MDLITGEVGEYGGIPIIIAPLRDDLSRYKPYGFFMGGKLFVSPFTCPLGWLGQPVPALIHDQLQLERWYKPPTIFRTIPEQVI